MGPFDNLGRADCVVVLECYHIQGPLVLKIPAPYIDGSFDGLFHCPAYPQHPGHKRPQSAPKFI